MPGPYSREFRQDAVEVARRRESGATLKQIGLAPGVSEATIENWLRQSDIEDGKRPGQAAGDTHEVRELRRQSRRTLPSCSAGR